MAGEIIRILSMDGGGIRGIIPARLLQQIEDGTGKSASALFHLMAGTSTGGILGCGLAKSKPAREIADLYAQRGGEIFHRSLWDKVTTIDGLSNPDYDPFASASVRQMLFCAVRAWLTGALSRRQ